MRKQGGGTGVQVFRITGARQGLQEDVRGRQRRYVISMTVRTLAVILAASLWNVERHVALVALVLGAVLPYIAVVIANAGRENAPGMPTTFVPTPLSLGTPQALPGPAETTVPHGARPEAESVPEDGPGGPAERP
ncbi:DUF3099 domain-containing protein [Streptomyces longwoodensis]|uniref:DUF3099 domain-containing protein n=1 Tax=Streptomyces lasalocidi TaxID=324833 RepID=A0A4V6AWV0_STRLS|nr:MULTISPECIES: DUF3099 domain-containing protein [Streptomyces]MCX4999082.1 DUF3099 domain-containing protein [Streptomyces longwoodensis]TKT00073.1 DUF3099 domain-containing protein [Streptomyces lasalocidi]WRY87865.1 DUF3099 domain-containing protein [Streptomyces longwoodensis]WTI47846.1 DUF3099 domain-containing protein [Streptomyces longwoodensis]